MEYFVIILLLIIVGLFFIARKNLMVTIGRNYNQQPLDPDKVPSSSKTYVAQSYFAYQQIKDDVMEEVSITSSDGLKLKGKLFKFNPATKKVCIGFHGFHAYGLRDMARFAPLYKSLGYDYLIIDQRTHNASEGKYITFGVNERYDGLLWIKEIIRRYGEDVQIVIHGVSMGAATVLMISGLKELAEQVKFVIADCSYSNMYDETEYVMKKDGAGNLQRKLQLAFTMFYGKVFVGCTIKEASPIDAVKNSKVPALLIHGKEDDYVPYYMLDAIDQAYAGEHHTYRVNGAAHAMSYVEDPEGYNHEIITLLNKYVR